MTARVRRGLLLGALAAMAPLVPAAPDAQAILAASDGVPTISRAAVQGYFARSYVPSPLTIFDGVLKVEPATMLCFRVRHGAVLDPTLTHFWNLVDVANRARAQRFTGSRDQGLDELQSRLSRAVGMRMSADVPLGAFLSGGTDSSTIVALMQRLSSRPVKTFTVGSDESDINESNFAREVARYLGTEHEELIVSGSEALAVVPRLPDIYDEPFADSSQIPTYLVSAMARRSVTVCGVRRCSGHVTSRSASSSGCSASSALPSAVACAGSRRPIAL